MNPENYWQARPGTSELRQLEQFFAQILDQNSNIFEVISIYSSLRNDQYCCLNQILRRWGAEISWFIEKYDWNTQKLGKKIISNSKRKLVLKNETFDEK